MFPVTNSLKGAAVGNVCKSLLKHGLIEEFEATDLNTVWRQDEERGPITLRATPLAYTALGIAEDTSEAVPAETATAPEPVRRRRHQAGSSDRHAARRSRTAALWPPRPAAMGRARRKGRP